MYNIPSKNLCDFFFFHFVWAMISLYSYGQTTVYTHCIWVLPSLPVLGLERCLELVEMGISSSSVFEICSCHFSFILELIIVVSIRGCIFLPENKGHSLLKNYWMHINELITTLNKISPFRRQILYVFSHL